MVLEFGAVADSRSPEGAAALFSVVLGLPPGLEEYLSSNVPYARLGPIGGHDAIRGLTAVETNCGMQD